MKKKIKFARDSKITVQDFDTLSSKFPQIITNLTEDTEQAFTERLERLNLIVIMLIVLLSHIFVLSFLMNVLSHFPIFLFHSKVLSYTINYLVKVAFSNLESQSMQWFLFLE